MTRPTDDRPPLDGKEAFDGAGQVGHVCHADHLACRVHREQTDTDVHGAHPQTGSGDGANGGAAWHVVVRDKLLLGNPRFGTSLGKDTRAYGVGGVALVGVDFEQGAATGNRADGGVVVSNVVGVGQVTGVR